ncbi:MULTISPECIES: hypothetical protein [Flavobacterium]|uniref:hypothetical protein n=1 Tax=Flavobacterium TaxID=237 RepID=UPI001FCCA77C|nr:MULTISPECIES: hypothetical protein [Flavobacterium]UOK41516.1 hypothetical protein LZF87_09320 [Flavobacterium enshiense]
MKISVIIIVAVVIVSLLLVAYLIIRNEKDRKELENFLNNDYKKPEESEFNDGGKKD